jgi:RecB family exonuclease
VAEIEQLAAAIAEAKAGDPVAPVTVIVPSNYAALSVRRQLGRRGLGGGTGIVNVQFLNVARLAELLGAPAMARAGRRPLTRAVRTEAIRAALQQEPGAFAAVASHPSTLEALDRTFADLRVGSGDALLSVAAMGPRAADVVRLFDATRQRLGAYYDEHDLADAAAEAVTSGVANHDVGRVIVYAPRRLSAGMKRMVDALGAAVLDPDVAEMPGVARVLSAVDPDDEVRAAVRLLVDNVRAGTPLHRMALLWPTDAPYATLSHQHLAAAGIPHNGPATRTLAHTVAGTALTQLLALPARGFRRDDVMAWLASAPVIEIDGQKESTPASQWDVVSAAAGVIEGPDQWQGRLAAYGVAQLERKNDLALDEEVESWRLERIDTTIDRAARLRVFMAELVAALDCNALTTWTDFSAWASAVLHRYLGGDERHYRWPDDEQDAWRAVRDAVGQLAGLDEVTGGAAVDLERFAQAIAAELAAPAARHGRFGTGVFAAHLGAALGTDFDTVIVLGMAEGTLPSRRAEDPLLPDRERAAAGGELPMRGDRHGDELADFRSALAAANHQRILLWPRTDPRRSRERLPSRWLPASVEPESIESFQQGLSGYAPAGLGDYDLRELLHWTEQGGNPVDHMLAAELPSLGAGLVASQLRSGTAFTRFAGHVGPGHIDAVDRNAPMSPTSLEAYAVCPAKYFFSKVLHLGAPERPEEIRRIAPMTKGSLVHEVLEKFIVAVLADPDARTEERLLDLAESAFEQYYARGVTGVPLLWRYERDLIGRELRRFFAEDDDDSEPLAAELTFGRDGEQPVVLTLPDGRQIGFRGSADRVDRMADGTIRVTDYKTGSDFKYKALAEDPVARGQLLQLPLYGLAARERFGNEDTLVESRYWMVAEKSDFRRHPVLVDAETVERLRQVLGVLVEGITAGRFPARPGEEDWRGGWDHCRFCDFDRLCQADRDRAWERVRDTPELREYTVLAGEAAEA